MARLEPTAWTRLRASLDIYSRKFFNAYLAYELTPAEYVETFSHEDRTFTELRKRLEAAGYVTQKLSAAKRHPGSGRLHLLSMRRRPDLHPFDAVGTGLESYDARECQFHLHAFATDVRGFLDVFTHYELAPDLCRLGDETWGEALARWREHYRPQYDLEHVDREEWTYLRGVEDPELDL